MSCCCGKNNGNFYSRAFVEDLYAESANVGYDLTGVSCPFYNNNDCPCAPSLKDAARALTNQRVIIHVNGCKMCVVIIGIGDCFIKAVNPCTHRVVYFNSNRIDNIEDVLPRCY